MLRRLRALLADSGPITILAAIAAVGSFDHISHLAAKYGQHGWRSWAVAVCIDLVCVMAAREIQRDKRTNRRRRGLMSWPSLVLAGGITLTLAANLAEAPRSPWGWVLAATPAGAFLIAMSMLERRAGHEPDSAEETGLVWEDPMPVPPRTERESAPFAQLERVEPAGVPDHEATSLPEIEPAHSEPAAETEPQPGPPPALLAYARRVAAEHRAKHDRPVTADVLRARMQIAPELAASLIAHLDD
ncbi:DUF2637 domain-containing protein [Nonomuraea angiospora]|uniref:DUF2637 domain-containing protein n=1 Tax=Nonomuraea angiospora TaxID=46172 RepID=UPI003449AC3C